MRWILLCLLGACIVVFSPRVGQAQAVDIAEATRIAYENGARFFAEERYEEADKYFEEGYQLSHKPGFLWNLAESARLRGDYERARDLYHKYLDGAPDGTRRKITLQRLATLPKSSTPSLSVVDKSSSISLSQPSNMVDKKSGKPIYKKWWFWTVGAVVVGGTVTAIALTSTRSRSESLNPPNDGSLGTVQGPW